jgi:DNA primase
MAYEDSQKDIVRHLNDINLPPRSISLCDPASYNLEEARNYLTKRGFKYEDWETWNANATTDPQWNFRIILPVYNTNKKLITYQGRDYTGMAPERYKSLSNDLSVVPIKDTLYGEWMVRDRNILVVEGAFGVWRVGTGAVATYGCSWTNTQLDRLLKYENVYIMFDSDDQAQRSARRLASSISAQGLHAEVLSLPDELTGPDELDAETVKELREELCLGWLKSITWKG